MTNKSYIQNAPRKAAFAGGLQRFNKIEKRLGQIEAIHSGPTEYEPITIYGCFSRRGIRDIAERTQGGQQSTVLQILKKRNPVE
jgi:hypothetical protein